MAVGAWPQSHQKRRAHGKATENRIAFEILSAVRLCDDLMWWLIYLAFMWQLCFFMTIYTMSSPSFTRKRPSHGKLELTNSCWQTQVGVQACLQTVGIKKKHVCRLFLCRSHAPTCICQHEFANFSLPCKGHFSPSCVMHYKTPRKQLHKTIFSLCHAQQTIKQKRECSWFTHDSVL